MSNRNLLPLALAATGALAFGALLPVTADARIILGKGAGGVAIGDTSKDVVRALGKPGKVQRYKTGYNWLYPGYWITLTTRRTVLGVETGDPKQRTAKGIGPGSTRKQVQTAYPAAKCESVDVLDIKRCRLVTNVSGKKIPNVFVLGNNAKVYAVDIGSVGDFGG